MIFAASWHKDKIKTTVFTCHILSFDKITPKKRIKILGGKAKRWKNTSVLKIGRKL